MPDLNITMLWVPTLYDGQHRLLDIAERAGLAFAPIARPPITARRRAARGGRQVRQSLPNH